MHAKPAPRMAASALLAVRLLVVVPFTVLTVATCLYAFQLFGLLRNSLPAIASRELSRDINREVRIGRFGFWPGAIELDNVAISNRRTVSESNGEWFVRAHRIVIHYDLFHQLSPVSIGAESFGNIDVYDCSIFVQRFASANHQTLYNFSDLLSSFLNLPKKPHSKPFLGRIVLANSTICFSDYQAPARKPLRPAVNVIHALNGSVDFGSSRLVLFSGAGIGQLDRLGSVRFSGNAARDSSGRFVLQVAAGDSDAAYWSDYFAAFPQARVVSGRATARIYIDRLTSRPLPGSPLDISGTVEIRNTGVILFDPRFKHLAVSQLGGEARFSSAGFTVNGNARAGGQWVHVQGSVLGYGHAQLALEADSERLDAVKLARQFPQIPVPANLSSQPGPVRARITGSVADPSIVAAASAPTVMYAGNAVQNVNLQASYAHQVLEVPRASFQLLGGGSGSVQGSLITGLRTRVVFSGHADGLKLSTLRFLPSTSPSPHLSGVSDIDFVGENRNGPVTVTANVSVEHPQLNQTILQSARARIVWSPGLPVDIQTALLDSGHYGSAIVSGLVPQDNNGSLHLTAWLNGVDIAREFTPYIKANIGGRAYGEIGISGSYRDLHLVGRASLDAPHYAAIDADLVSGDFSASSGAVRLKDVVIRRYPSVATVSGTLTRLVSRDPQADLNVKISQGDVQDLIGLASQMTELSAAKSARSKHALSEAEKAPGLTGAVDATIHIAGGFHDPTIEGSAQVSNATYDIYRIRQASTNFNYHDNLLNIKDATLSSEDGGDLAGFGQYHTSNGLISANISGSNVPLNLFDSYTDRYATIEGVAAFHALVSGKFQRPTIDASASLNDLQIAGDAIDPVSLSGHYANGSFTKTGAPWVFAFKPPPQGNIADTSPKPAIKYVIDRLQFSLISQSKKPQPLPFLIAGSIPADSPDTFRHIEEVIHSEGVAHSAIGEKIIEQLNRLPSKPDGNVWVPSVVVEGSTVNPHIQVTVGMGDVHLEGYSVGRIAANIDYLGGESPILHAQGVATDLDVQGIPVQSVDLNGSFANRVIQVDHIDVRGSEAYIHGTGQADLDGKIAATVDASNVPLALFNTFLKPAPRTPRRLAVLRELSGTIGEITLEASGRTNNPNFIGSISLTKPGVTITSFANAADAAGPIVNQYHLESIRSGAISVEDVRPDSPVKIVTISSLSAFHGGRPVATVSGSFPLGAQLFGTDNAVALSRIPSGLPLHAELDIPNLSEMAQLAPNTFDPATTSGALKTTIDVLRTGNRSSVTGALSLSGGSFGLTGFETSLQHINAIVHLNDGSLLVNQLTAMSSNGGTIGVTGGGSIGIGSAADASPGLNGQANLQVYAKNFHVNEDDRQTFLAKAFNSSLRANVNGALNITGPWSSPLLSTAPSSPILITDAAGTLPSATSNAAAKPQTYPFNPRFDIALKLGNRAKTVTVRGPLFQAEGAGNLSLAGSLSDPQIKSHVAVARGQLILPPSTLLRIVRAPTGEANSVDVNYPVPSSDPATAGDNSVEMRVNLTAEAKVNVAPQQTSTGTSPFTNVVGQSAPDVSAFPYQNYGASGQRYTITVHIHGLLNGPNPVALDLSSSPPNLSRQAMLEALVPASALGNVLNGGQGAERAFSNELGVAFNQVALPAIFSPIEAGLADALGLQDLSVDYSPDAPVLVILTKTIAPRLDLTYTRLVGARTPGAVNAVVLPPAYQLRLGYGLTNRIRVSVTTDDQHNNTLSLDGILGF